MVRKGEDGSVPAFAVTTQWVMGDLEKAGLLKMDFLGLRTLTMLENALRMIERNHAKRIDLRKLNLDDPDVYKLLQRGDAKGVFQLEGNGIRELLKKLKPDNIRDIIALMALYRPGPLEGGMVDSYVNRKHGREKPTYAHPVIKEVLEETYGVMVYQEQIMRILNRLGGIELSSAYACIKAISKKKYDIIDQRKAEFLRGAVERGLAQEIAEEIFQLIVVFGGYGFNKSHTAAYAMVGYQTAYLKAHYLSEFMAALLSSEIEDGNKRDVMVEHIAEARKSGVEVLAPNINSSEVEFEATREGRITFGLLAIKGVGRAAAVEIVRARNEGGRFKDLYDLTERVDPRLVPKAAMEKLTKAGAMDILGGHRAQIMMGISGAVQAAQEKHADRKMGQKGLFETQEIAESAEGGAQSSLPDVPKWPDAEKLRQEKEVLDFYFSSHPLASQERELKRFATHTIEQFAHAQAEDEVVVGGLLVNLKSSNTKKARNGNSRFLRFRLEDLSGGIDCVIWPDDLARHKEDPKPDLVYYIKGRLERRGEAPNLIVSRILDLETARKELARALFLRVSLERNDSSDLDLVARILRKAPGPLGVTLKIEDAAGRGCAMKLGNGYSINPQKLPLDELESVLGPENVKLA
jgi:DNA polymerase-3 subunit alpha